MQLILLIIIIGVFIPELDALVHIDSYIVSEGV